VIVYLAITLGWSLAELGELTVEELLHWYDTARRIAPRGRQE